ncbi:CPBP family intramembrane metalloprotease [Carboxylicivirga sediminis]|uniref:CPBP family intramembrane metalloprotease n=1 Tax=Carboxylicivirga sediminis TaxID=2006564 RepID=A0A941F3Z9_9BACT|nr:CPBP family intramembrane glutamic endopeptidase [Carboxylicivirga sediminis]MBR8534860.1 CPBP family intramembrane metalloprotease [Carboxylicivirga sediminis]
MKHLESSYTGQNEWWKYLLLILISFLGGQFFGAIPLLVVLAWAGSGNIDTAAVQSMDFAAMGINSSLGLALIILPFILSLVLFVVLFKAFHQRTFATVINGTKAIRWRRVIIGAGLWGMIMAFTLVVDYYMNIDNYEMRLNWNALIVLALVSILLIPFQAFYEEILFRGYLAQGIGRLFKNRILVLIIPSVFFALMHGTNPEIQKFGFWVMMPQYFIMGFVYALISVFDDGIELAMGAHAVNNVFISMFVTADGLAFQTDALLKAHEIDPSKELGTLLVASLVFVGALAFKYRWQLSALFRKIEAPVEEV